MVRSGPSATPFICMFSTNNVPVGKSIAQNNQRVLKSPGQQHVCVVGASLKQFYRSDSPKLNILKTQNQKTGTDRQRLSHWVCVDVTAKAKGTQMERYEEPETEDEQFGCGWNQIPFVGGSRLALHGRAWKLSPRKNPKQARVSRDNCIDTNLKVVFGQNIHFGLSLNEPHVHVRSAEKKQTRLLMFSLAAAVNYSKHWGTWETSKASEDFSLDGVRSLIWWAPHNRSAWLRAASGCCD